MEKIKIGELIKLDDNKEYICFFELEELGINYLYLVTQTKPVEVKFAKYKLDDTIDSITIIGDPEEKMSVLKMFQEKMKNLN